MGRPTVVAAIEAIQQCGGFVSTAARRLKTSRTTLHAMINKHPKLKEAVDDAREAKKDHAEGKLLNLIDQENVTAIIFYLKTQAKERGYVERQQMEHSGPDGGPQEVKIDFSKLSDEQLNKLVETAEHLQPAKS